MKLVFYKSKELPIGHITTNASGQKVKKVAPGKWIPVSESSQGSSKEIKGLTFKDGFYFDGKTKITNNYEKAKTYMQKKESQKTNTNAGNSIKVGDTIRVKSNAKSNGKVTEHKEARGMVARVQEIGDKFVKIIDDAGKVFQVNKMALEFAKSNEWLISELNLIKSGSRYLNVYDPEFIKQFKDICLNNSYKKLPEVEGYPKGLDLENYEIMAIGEDYVKMVAGGDWQQMTPFSFAVKRINKKPIIIDLFNNDISKSHRKEVNAYLKEIKEDDGNVQKSNILIFDLCKGRPYPVGTIREYSGKKYQKNSNGKWLPVKKDQKKNINNETYEDKDKSTFYSKQIINILNYVKDKYGNDENLAGIRIMSSEFDDYDKKKNDELNNSHKWELGQPTEEDLGGVSTININANSIEPGYHGNKVFIVGSYQGKDAGWNGEDKGEKVVPDPYVIDVITREEYDKNIKNYKPKSKLKKIENPNERIINGEKFSKGDKISLGEIEGFEGNDVKIKPFNGGFSQRINIGLLPYYKNNLKKSKELQIGIKVEKEHSNTIKKIKGQNLDEKQSATLIAKDHMQEAKDKGYNYYKRLLAIEGLEDRKGIDGKIIKFIKTHNFIEDEKGIHEFAKTLNMNPDKLEEKIYAILKDIVGNEIKKSKSLIFNLQKARPIKYIKRIPKSGGGYKYIYKKDQKKNTILKYDDLPIKNKIKFKTSNGKEILLNKVYHSQSSNSVYETYKLGNNEIKIRFSDHKKQSSSQMPVDFSFDLSKRGTEEIKEKIKSIFEEELKKKEERKKTKFPLYKKIKEQYGLKINQKTKLGIIKDFIHYEGEGDFAEMEAGILYDVKDVIDANKKQEVKKSSNLVFNLFKSDQKLDKIKKILLSILDKQMEKSFTFGIFDLIKGKAYPIGTKRDWKNKKFIKVTKGKWRRLYEGESRGQKQSIAYIRKQIENAKSISELAKIVFENKKRFLNSDGSYHNVVKQLLELAKSKKPKKEVKPEKKEFKVPDFNILFNKQSDNVRGKDKQKRKTREYTPTQKENEVIDEERKQQIETAMEIDSKLEAGESIDELRNGENYYNEKPSEILNTGKEVWGAARHKYDTYEVSELNLEQMEKDGVAQKMINKRNLLQEPTLDGLDERVKNGEDGSKILLEAVIYKILKSSPDNDDIKDRQRYNDFCRLLNRSMAETETAKELYVALVNGLEPYKKSLSYNYGYNSDPNAIKNASHAESIIGKELLSLFFPSEYQYRKKGMRLDDLKMMKNTLSIVVNPKPITEEEAKIIMFGEKQILKEKGIGTVKKGDKVLLKQNEIEQFYRVKKFFDTKEKEELHNKELQEVNKRSSELAKKESDDLIKDFKNTEDYKRIKKIKEENALQYFNALKNKYTKKDGTLTIRGKEIYDNIDNLNQKLKEYQKQGEKELRYWALRQLKPDTIDYEKRREFELFAIGKKLIDDKYLTTQQIKISSNEVIVSKTTKDGFVAVIEFEDGRKMEKNFPYSLIESVNQTEKVKKFGKQIDYYIETKADRKGGTNKYNNMSPVNIQKELHDKFKIKSTVFGNSVPDKEREFHLRKTAEAFSDLSEVLKLDENIVSANGKLGIAWGAFGGLSEHGALAAYYPDQKLLTLTRKKGFGSFAHEWGHFLDHILGGGKNNYSSDGGGFLKRVMEKPDIIPDGSILTIKKKSRSGKITKTRYYYDSKGNKSYPYIRLDKGQIRPTFIKGQDKRYSFYDSSLARMIKLSPELNILEIPRTEKEARVSNTAKETASYIAAIMQEDLRENEAIFDATYPDSDIKEWYKKNVFLNGYLNGAKECFARAFEVYMSDKLRKMNRENTYLASQKKTKQDDGKYTYPQKEERRKEIYDLFEKFFDQIRNSEELRKSIDRIFGKKIVFKI